MTVVAVSRLSGEPINQRPLEVVERKGLGHPDTLCDALAEAVSRALCRHYLDNFDLILHHNVDKALLWGGAATTAFGGGRVDEPMEVFVSGRATREFEGRSIPVDEIVTEAVNDWLDQRFHALDPAQHVKVRSLVRPGSSDLVELYRREQQTGIALANDTSCGVGYAPLSELEQVVKAVEQRLNQPALKQTHPAIGEDIKVMGVRQGEELCLTIACALVDRHCADLDEYRRHRETIRRLSLETAGRLTARSVSVDVNTADDLERGSVYLTVTGTSAEAGDDGEVGRGNRVNGLITPYRPMTLEAAAGKNPVTHVGKLYNIAAQQIAEALVAEYETVSEACCYLVSRIGTPVHEPQAMDLQLRLPDELHVDALRPRPEEVAREVLANLRTVRDELVAGRLTLY